MKNKPFLDKTPGESVRSITPNGTLSDSGGESYNGFYPRGSDGTKSVGTRTSRGPVQGNRTGEGGGYGWG